MRKKLLNKINLDIFNNMIHKKLLDIEFLQKKDNDIYYEKILNDFFEPEPIQDVLNDPMLQFDNNLFDYDYFAAKFKGFDSDGWDCIDLLIEHENKIVNQVLNKQKINDNIKIKFKNNNIIV